VLHKNFFKIWLPIALVVIFLLFAGFMAITQEAEEDSVLDDMPLDDMLADFFDDYIDGEELPPAWEPFGPPRWFRSNAGGMTLEETPSRLAALRNTYALVIDYAPPDEIEPRLLPYFHSDYIIEIRILYERGAVVRRQWLFRDEAGNTRLNAVFVPPADEEPEMVELDEDEIAAIELEPEEYAINDIDNEIIAEADELAADELAIDELATDELAADEPAAEEPVVADELREAPKSLGFIEIFNEQTWIVEERNFYDDDSETLILYSYTDNILTKAEAHEKRSGADFHVAYIDHYRYNRSYSLRHVERRFHEASSLLPIRLTFPGRVLDAALDENFISDKLTVSSDFLGTATAQEGYRMIYTTDSRGRILTQTMYNEKDEEVWMIYNTWSGDRIVTMKKIEGEDEKMTEYEYNKDGDRIVQRDINNGVLERLVQTDGENETEELYLDGILVLKAYWVDGRKVSEERVRRR